MIAETAHFLNIKEVTVGCGALGARFDVMKPDVDTALLLTDGLQWQWNDPTTGCLAFGRAIGTSNAPGEDSSMPWWTKMDINRDVTMLLCMLAILIYEDSIYTYIDVNDTAVMKANRNKSHKNICHLPLWS